MSIDLNLVCEVHKSSLSVHCPLRVLVLVGACYRKCKHVCNNLHIAFNFWMHYTFNFEQEEKVLDFYLFFFFFNTVFPIHVS